MKRVLILIAGLLAFPLPALATPTYHILTESDPGGLNNVNLFGFENLTDLINLNNPSSASINSLAPGISISGLTYDGSRYHIITESDPGGLNNVNLFSFDSLTDLINLNNPSSASINGLAPGISISGLTYDDSQYRIMTESDPGGLNNVNLFSFGSLTDLINLTNPSSASLNGLAPGISISGLMTIPEDPPQTQVPEPQTFLLFGFGLAGILFGRRRVQTQTQSSGYAVRSSS